MFMGWSGASRVVIHVSKTGANRRGCCAIGSELWEVDVKFATLALGCLAAATLMTSSSPATAVVYCKYVGVPKGCVVKPGVVLRPAPVVVTPAPVVVAPAPVIVAPAVAAPVAAAAVATPGVGAPGVGVRAGTPANRGGPVNRVGRR